MEDKDGLMHWLCRSNRRGVLFVCALVVLAVLVYFVSIPFLSEPVIDKISVSKPTYVYLALSLICLMLMFRTSLGLKAASHRRVTERLGQPTQRSNGEHCREEGSVWEYVFGILIVCAAASLYTGFVTRICSAVFAILLLRGIVRRQLGRPRLILLLFLGYFLLQLLGLLYSPDLRQGLHQIQAQLPLLLVPAALSVYTCRAERLRQIWVLLLRVGEVYLITTLLNYAFLMKVYGGSILEAFVFDKFYFPLPGAIDITPYYATQWTGFTHPTYLMICLVAPFIPLAIEYIRRTYDHRRIGIEANACTPVVSGCELILYTLLFGLFSLITQSRISMIVLALGIAFYSIFLIHLRLRRRFLPMSSLLILILSACLVMVAMILLLDPVRIEISQVSIQSILSNPWGTGTGSMGDILRRAGVPIEHRHPHSQLMAELMQIGIFGGIYFLAMVAAIFVIICRRKDYASLLFFGIVLLVLNIESPLSYARGVWAVSILLSLYLVSGRSRQQA